MCDPALRMFVLQTDDLEASIAFYVAGLGMTLKFRDGDRYAAIDGGPITIALATPADHPLPGEVVMGLKTTDVDTSLTSMLQSGAKLVREAYDDLHERRAVVRDPAGNAIVLYSALPNP